VGGGLLGDFGFKLLILLDEIVCWRCDPLGVATRRPPGRMKMGNLDRFGRMKIDPLAKHEAGCELVLLEARV
jgi:hypothetical protein